MAAGLGRTRLPLILTLLLLLLYSRCGLGYNFVDTIAKYGLPVPNSAVNITQVNDDFDLWDDYDTLSSEVYENAYWYLNRKDSWNATERQHGLQKIEDNINSWANYCFPHNASYDSLGTTLVFPAYNDTQYNLYDKLYDAYSSLWKSYSNVYYAILGDYMGVGIDVKCKDDISNAIAGRSIYDQTGANAATTLMGIIPALLTFGNLYVARSSEAFGTSFLVGAISALFSLGLPVRSISGVSRKQTISLASFDYIAQSAIEALGKLRKREKDGSHFKAKNRASLEEFQSYAPRWDKKHSNQKELETGKSFASIRHQAKDKWRRRAHLWRIPAFLVAGVQIVIFLFAVGPLFMGWGTSMLIFDCKNYWTSLWLLLSAAISALFRFVMWEKGHHERAKVFSLSRRSVDELRHLCRVSACYQADWGYKRGTTETEMPPLYPPFLLRCQQIWFNLVGNKLYALLSSVVGGAERLIKRLAGVKSPSSSSTPSNYGDDNNNINWDLKNQKDTSLLKYWKSLARLVLIRLIYLVTHVRELLLAGFLRASAEDSARRWRPLVILLHLSTTGRNPLVTLFTGAVEGVILVVLTFFFSAQWGGNLVVTFYSMVVLLVAVTIGRALGIWYVWRSAKEFGLHVIECESTMQIRGCLRILCSMKDVLVYVNGAWFFEGYRVDIAEGWLEWEREYNRGTYDYPLEPTLEEAGNDPRTRIGIQTQTQGLGLSYGQVQGQDASKAVSTTAAPVPVHHDHDHIHDPETDTERGSNATSASTSV
ncbi:hypothetical protein L228DRAFT_281988 [Xylona heveae TC161]|uniref:Uncharacterized protein n=1 Tax=Xylona heveae (strain CBS 132557 / TC161) TaxID=1328760 RepID=A0A165HB99_XYLHT|nr:hypothetical protein L228DRAFT_281988 [Xylona heveae TC161]KZF23248.1 hypothetical protein L228DRAFT_281988 [Xylona heveae TC161]